MRKYLLLLLGIISLTVFIGSIKDLKSDHNEIATTFKSDISDNDMIAYNSETTQSYYETINLDENNSGLVGCHYQGAPPPPPCICPLPNGNGCEYVMPGTICYNGTQAICPSP